MRARCSASTLILVAAWEQSLHPGSPGHRLAHRKGPLNAENAVRTTGLLVSRRNAEGLNGPRLPTVPDAEAGNSQTCASFSDAPRLPNAAQQTQGVRRDENATPFPKPIPWWDVHFGILKTTEEIQRLVISPLVANRVGTNSAILRYVHSTLALV